ncbi:MAG: hypothetical protein AVDCRST_MAG59-3833 [uncultured Thermomicrobiales bacterium]|uniref:Uncharacterized protein n=1 Tax=uncultured Thermomicrobiales bacterium TaxID=1645740 RepID=A0A6J4VE09_9BACT|nr:MAG: hypothetical protein AVDCRST_MAG59-3833 [uncultured Thermomicrobiales bacterium]
MPPPVVPANSFIRGEAKVLRSGDPPNRRRPFGGSPHWSEMLCRGLGMMGDVRQARAQTDHRITRFG